MAKALLQRQYAHESRITNHQLLVSSAGLRGLDGQPAHPLAQSVVKAYGGNLSDHKARTVTPDLLARSDLILTMEEAHRHWIIEKMPYLEPRVHPLGRWHHMEIPDPMGGTEADFRLTLQQINACLQDWLPLLPPRPTVSNNQS